MIDVSFFHSRLFRRLITVFLSYVILSIFLLEIPRIHFRNKYTPSIPSPWRTNYEFLMSMSVNQLIKPSYPPTPPPHTHTQIWEERRGGWREKSTPPLELDPRFIRGYYSRKGTSETDVNGRNIRKLNSNIVWLQSG
jgi:hypothetical protein